MPAERMMPTEESDDLIQLTREIVDKEMRPIVDQYEREHTFPPGSVSHPRPRRTVDPALPRGVRRPRPAQRGLPPGRGGDRLGVGRGRCRG